jgi:hypothetical protein
LGEFARYFSLGSVERGRQSGWRQAVCGTSDFEIGSGCVKQTKFVVMTAGVVGCAIWPCSGVVDEEMVLSEQWVRQAARRSALDAQAVLRKARAGRDRRLEGLAVAVLTAIGERDAAVRDAERRTGEALVAMTDQGGCRCARRSTGAAAASRPERSFGCGVSRKCRGISWMSARGVSAVRLSRVAQARSMMV